MTGGFGRRSLKRRAAALAMSLAVLVAGTGLSLAADRLAAPADAVNAFLDVLQRRTFHYFWDLTDPVNGLTPDRGPGPAFCSVAAVGFALTAYPIGAERGFVTRRQAARRVLTTLQFLWRAPQGPGATGVTGHKGFYYHFLDATTGHRYQQVELSTLDTALLVAGALFCQSYFTGDDPAERAIRGAADRLYRRVAWDWAEPRPPAIALAWSPERGFQPFDYRGYNEAMILYVLALGSPTHPVAKEAWAQYTSGYQWKAFYGYEHLNFGPLFGHQYSHVWIDFRGIQDAFMRQHGCDYFENSRRATHAQRAYAIDNQGRWTGYGANIWGLTACDGPVDGPLEAGGRERHFHTYWARGACSHEINDDGTIAPAAAAGSIAFAPEIVIPALRAMKDRLHDDLFGRYGFRDAFNLTFRDHNVRLTHGRVVPGKGWFDTEYVGINQGPIVAMIENHRSGLIWNRMRKNRYVVAGLRRAGFSGGWLDADQRPRRDGGSQ